MAATEENLIYFRNGGSVRQAPATAGMGRAPALILVNPKYPHNVGGAIRMASCYGIGQVWYTGDRVALMSKNERIPREERMRSYAEVTLFNHDRPFELFPVGERAAVTPVAVEFRHAAESLLDFEHPANPVYVFGPEDGSIPQHLLRLCHRFVHVPTRHCLNLSVAVGTVLYDRMAKSGRGVDVA